jgi:hypothetical protein
VICIKAFPKCVRIDFLAKYLQTVGKEISKINPYVVFASIIDYRYHFKGTHDVLNSV